MSKKDINSILERNKRVEIDKSWELSWTRRILISAMTYLFILIFLILIEAPNPFLNALVPVTGFILSTLSLPFFKKLWIERYY